MLIRRSQSGAGARATGQEDGNPRHGYLRSLDPETTEFIWRAPTLGKYIHHPPSCQRSHVKLEGLDNQLVPMSNYGVKSMSMGYLVGEEAPVVWRGLMVMKALQQLLHEVEWGGLDVLVLDLPPGTGDTQLTITQQIVVDGMGKSLVRV